MPALLRASHPAPTVAVTTIAVLLGVAAGLEAGTVVLLTVAVLAGQLAIGWSNDLIDAERDARVGRRDKPLATGQVSRVVVRAALAAVLVVCVATSLALGVATGVAHLLLLVGSGLVYNAWLKRTAWSALPYLLAFGTLPALPWLARPSPVLPPLWMVVVGSLLGLGAHLLNVLPDLEDDAATAVRGMPHRLGRRASGWLALTALVVATVVAVVGPSGPVPGWAWAVLAVATALAAWALRAGGRAPFTGAMLIALLDVVMLLLRGP